MECKYMCNLLLKSRVSDPFQHVDTKRKKDERQKSVMQLLLAGSMGAPPGSDDVYATCVGDWR